MIEPLDRSRRDSTLLQFTSKQLQDFIDPHHLLIQIYEQLDFARLVAPLEEYYCPDFGRPAIHPEVMVRALLICSLYNIASFRRLCSTILPSRTSSTGCQFSKSLIRHVLLFYDSVNS